MGGNLGWMVNSLVACKISPFKSSLLKKSILCCDSDGCDLTDFVSFVGIKEVVFVHGNSEVTLRRKSQVKFAIRNS